MITKEELIEKCKGLYFKPANKTELNICVDKCKKIGVNSYATLIDGNHGTFVILENGMLCRRTDSILHSTITAKEFLSYFEEEPKMKIEEKDGDYTITMKAEEPPKPQSKKDFLLNRIKQIETHKKEFLKTVDAEIKSIHGELSCKGCHVNEDGVYNVTNSSDADKMKGVAEFINRMEADFE